MSDEPSPEAITVAKQRGGRGRRFVLGALVLVVVLVLATIGYLYWNFLSFHRLDEVGSKQLDPRTVDVTRAPGQTIVTIAPPDLGVAITTTTAFAIPATVSSGSSPIPPPGTPNTVAGLPGPATVAPSTVPETVDTAPLPGLSLDGLDPKVDDTLPPALVTIPANQVKNHPLVDTSGVPAVGGKNTINILMTGVDRRDNVPENQAVGLGKGLVTGARSDTIMILRVDPDAKKAWVLSLPRDLWLRMPGTNSFDRINSSSARSDAELIRTIQENLNIPIHHMMKVDFVGFQKVVSTVGGVNICFEKPARDKITQLNQPFAGCTRLNPTQATAYVRSRHYEEQQPDGTWKTDPRSDLGRIARQQTFIRNGMAAAIDRGFRNPTTLNAALSSLRSAIAFDKSLGFTELLSLANKLRSFDPASLESSTVPVVPRRIDNKAVLVLDTTKAAAALGRFGHRSS